MDLQNKVVAITGGGTGIGASIAISLATAGAKVTVGGRRAEPLGQLAVDNDTPHRLRPVPIDVAEDESITAFFDAIEAADGPVDILVNSAGINIANRRMDSMQPEDWDRVMRINATGAYRCIHRVLPAMRSRREGLIINISSIAGKRAIALGGVVYCASKFAMTAMGTAIGSEVKDEGVRVTNVYPGEVNTPILANRPVPVSEEHKAQILQPEDVAAMVLAICQLPARAHVPELIIKPTTQDYV